MHFKIEEEVFDSELHVFIGVDYSVVLDYMKKNWNLKVEDEVELQIGPSTDAQINLFKNHRVGVLWLRRNPGKDALFIADVSHEVTHWAMDVMMKMGTKYLNDEPICYFIQFYTKNIFLNIERIFRDDRKKKARRKISQSSARNRKRPVRRKHS